MKVKKEAHTECYGGYKEEKKILKNIVISSDMYDLKFKNCVQDNEEQFEFVIKN